MPRRDAALRAGGGAAGPGDAPTMSLAADDRAGSGAALSAAARPLCPRTPRCRRPAAAPRCSARRLGQSKGVRPPLPRWIGRSTYRRRRRRSKALQAAQASAGCYDPRVQARLGEVYADRAAEARDAGGCGLLANGGAAVAGGASAGKNPRLAEIAGIGAVLHHGGHLCLADDLAELAGL